MRPVSIKTYAWLFALSCGMSLWLAWRMAGVTDFGFPLNEAAARQLASRILYVRLAGVALAVWLMTMIIVGRSRAARGALSVRWVIGLATSVGFLRGVGVLPPGVAAGPEAVAVSIAQLIIEGFAILILFGEDAADWFEQHRAF